MADPEILGILKTLFAKTSRRKIGIAAICRAVPGTLDIKRECELLEALAYLDSQGTLKLPSKQGRGWQPLGILPLYVTLFRPKEDKRRTTRKTQLARLRERTPWEPEKMAGFAHTLTSKKQLEQAAKVNRYFLNRRQRPTPIPHREKALEIFGLEKALDGYVHTGLFSGRITLADIDCFYCPEPLPYEVFSTDPEKTRERPLLLVENSATYWSCCRANQAAHPLKGGFFAAVVFGKGFKASRSTPIQSLDSLSRIEKQTRAKGVFYFGDLDPAGLDIPRRINNSRDRYGLPHLRCARDLYRALLKKGLTTRYDKPQDRFHDPRWAVEWLGKDLAGPYLEHCRSLRWPQEGLTANEIARILAGQQEMPCS